MSRGACAYIIRKATGGHECCETLEEHVQRSLEVWLGRLKKCYSSAVNRIIYSQGSQTLASVLGDPVAVAIVLHDIGKTVPAYQEKRIMRGRVQYRHELVSGALSLIALEKAADMAGIGENERGLYVFEVPLAVMMHHESISMGVLAGELGERFVTLSVASLMLEDYYDGELWGLERLARTVKNMNVVGDEVVDVLKILSGSPPSRKEVINALGRLKAYSLSGDTLSRLSARARVAGILHPLVVADSIAANEGRKRCNGDGGTWIVKRALGRDGQAPAEPCL
ncbi:CRISPR-associated protein [Aeropyrum camini SY1 = JCM 12091]|uniref:CRISPR-associated protein n=2 Tax=Aeropyrum camini TaxID=229980 RepID=U3TE60_9CREN|nr:CRISPR-associated protein [Aeropyrum camini SY1 = JCM 12091]